MGKVKDLTGQRFGRLVVVSRGEDYVSPSGDYKRPRWLCQCDCGGTALVQGGTLVVGRSKSCGCLQRELLSKRRKQESHVIDISGQRFGRLTAVEFLGLGSNRSARWRCICDCGNEMIAQTNMLRSGNTKSCGCLRDELIADVNKRHGKSHSRLYNVWNGMRQRCNDPAHKSYDNYGGRGITVCDEWQCYESFEKWAIDTGYDINAPYGECTIDRIDVNGNYEPSNCRWATMAEQARNRR